jgi:hypothetical protein
MLECSKIKKLIGTAVLFVCAAFTIQSYASGVNPEQKRPNILIFISDDQGYGDFGFTGNKIVRTPNLDQLSNESAFYPHFMVGPACTPTRSALFTGRNHLDAGVWGVGSRGRVRRDEIMMPKFFNPSGYHTWTFGKLDDGEIRNLARSFTLKGYTPLDVNFFAGPDRYWRVVLSGEQNLPLDKLKLSDDYRNENWTKKSFFSFRHFMNVSKIDLSIEPYGDNGTLNNVASATVSVMLMAEHMDYFGTKLASSPAHLYDKPVVSVEAFTITGRKPERNWSTAFEDIKSWANNFFSGVVVSKS